MPSDTPTAAAERSPEQREEWKQGYLARLDRDPRDVSRSDYWLRGWDDGEEACK